MQAYYQIWEPGSSQRSQPCKHHPTWQRLCRTCLQVLALRLRGERPTTLSTHAYYFISTPSVGTTEGVNRRNRRRTPACGSSLGLTIHHHIGLRGRTIPRHPQSFRGGHGLPLLTPPLRTVRLSLSHASLLSRPNSSTQRTTESTPYLKPRGWASSRSTTTNTNLDPTHTPTHSHTPTP